MLVVIGIPIAAPDDEHGGVSGTPALAAIAAARGGTRVELVGKIGDDAAGDAVVLALGQRGVGHAALLREPGRSTPTLISSAEPATPADDPENGRDERYEPADRARWPSLEAADVELALRYLPDVRTILVAEPLAEDVLRAVGDTAAYLGARLIVTSTELDPPPSADLAITPPEADPDGSFAGLLGELGAAVEAGDEANAAFDALRSRLGIDATGA
jgi:hypothetical protein